MILAPGREDGSFILCLREKNPLTEIWDGHMEGLNGVKKNYEADQSFDIEDLETILSSLFLGRQKVFFTLGQDEVLDKILMKASMLSEQGREERRELYHPRYRHWSRWFMK